MTKKCQNHTLQSNQQHHKVLSLLATDILTNSSLSCELDIYDLIGAVHSSEKDAILCMSSDFMYSTNA